MNTDDYEGHTPGPWKLVEGDPYDELGCWLDIVSEHGDGFGPFEIQQCVGFSDGEDDPNVKLMVAAPNLLAEVKRLREALITVQRLLTWDEKDREMDGDPVTLEALVEQVEWVRSNIMEMIE